MVISANSAMVVLATLEVIDIFDLQLPCDTD
jgi:hypothetical protein